MSGREVALHIYVEPGKEDRCAYAMDSLKRAMRWDEEAFGREYDLDIFMIVAVSAFNMGAMENKGLNVFNDKYVLASPTSATDTDYAHIEAVIAHEYFHNWTGDRITCRDWFQLCLKEGLTVFRDQEFSADQRSRAVERIGDVRALRSHQFVEDAGPLAHPVRPELYQEINNFYTTTVYDKGAEVVRMIKTLLGPDMFRKGMDLYFTRHDGQAATVEQFVQCFADVSGRDMTQFMRWYSQAGTPEIKVAPHYDARAQTYRLDITQTIPPTPGQPTKEPMVIPLAVGLVGKDGGDLPLTLDGQPLERGVLELTQPSQTFVFTGDRRAADPFAQPRLFGADQAVAADRARRSALPRRARSRSVQSLAGGADAGDVAAQGECRGVRVGRAGARGRRPDGRARRDLGRRKTRAGLHRARRWRRRARPTSPARSAATSIPTRSSPRAASCARRSAKRHGAALEDTYERMITTGPYRPDAQSAGRRALKNVCLDLLAIDGAQRSDRAGAVAIRERRQHDRPHGGARDAVAARPAGARCGARRFLSPLSRRSADHRQVARAAGGDPRARRRSTACAR